MLSHLSLPTVTVATVNQPFEIPFQECGDFIRNISADTLTVGCRRNIKPEMAEIKGKRLGYFIGQYRNTYFKPDKMNVPVVYSYKPLPNAENAI